MYRLCSDAWKQTQQANVAIHLSVDIELGCSVGPPHSVPVNCGNTTHWNQSKYRHKWQYYSSFPDSRGSVCVFVLLLLVNSHVSLECHHHSWSAFFVCWQVPTNIFCAQNITFNIHFFSSQWGKIWRVESVKTPCIHFGDTVSSVQIVMEV